MTSFFFRFMGGAWKRYFSNRPGAKIVTILLFLAIVAAIAFGVFWGVKSGFTLMNQQSYGRETLPLYTYELFFLVLGYLMFTSAIISGLFLIFRGNQNNWIAASPNFKSLLTQSGLRIFSSAIWTLLVIGIPAVVALAQVYGAGSVLIPAGLVGLVLLTIITSMLAMILILLLATAFYPIRGATWRMLRTQWLVLTSGIFVVGLAAVLWQTIVHMDVLSLFVSGPTNAAQANINGIVSAFRFLPTNPMALLMLALQEHSWNAALGYLGWLALVAVLSVVVIYLFSFNFLRLWQRMQESSFEARTTSSSGNTKPRAFPRFIRSDIGAIFEKEFVVNFRNMRDSLWVIFILGLWILQTALNLFLRHNASEYGTSEIAILASIQALQVATAVFFISTFTLRFALPSFSSDRRMSWILGTAPIAPRRIFLSKLAFYGTVFLLLGLGIGIGNAAALGVPLATAGAFLALLITMILAITVFGLSVGAIFPNTESDDPESISTSLQGLGFTFASLFYGGMGAWIYYIFAKTGEAAPLWAFVLYSLAFSIALAALSAEKLRTFNPFSEELGEKV